MELTRVGMVQEVFDLLLTLREIAHLLKWSSERHDPSQFVENEKFTETLHQVIADHCHEDPQLRKQIQDFDEGMNLKYPLFPPISLFSTRLGSCFGFAKEKVNYPNTTTRWYFGERRISWGTACARVIPEEWYLPPLFTHRPSYHRRILCRSFAGCAWKGVGGKPVLTDLWHMW